MILCDSILLNVLVNSIFVCVTIMIINYYDAPIDIFVFYFNTLFNYFCFIRIRVLIILDVSVYFDFIIKSSMDKNE